MAPMVAAKLELLDTNAAEDGNEVCVSSFPERIAVIGRVGVFVLLSNQGAAGL